MKLYYFYYLLFFIHFHRLEAGLCLYGHDINENITPIEASLTWLIGMVSQKSLINMIITLLIASKRF